MHFILAIIALAFRTLAVPAVIMTATLYALTCVLIEDEEIKRIFLIVIGPIMMMAPPGKKKGVVEVIELANRLYPEMIIVLEDWKNRTDTAAVRDNTPTVYINRKAWLWGRATEEEVGYVLAHEWAHVLQHKIFTEKEMNIRHFAASSYPGKAYASVNVNEDEAEAYAILIYGPQHGYYPLNDEGVQRWLWNMWYLWESRGHTLPRPKFPYPGATEL